MMNQQERRAFVENHRTYIFGFQRKDGPPSISVVYYVVDGDDILVSTMRARAKAKAVRRCGEVSLCVLDEKWPLTYLQVYGPAAIDDTMQTTVDVMMKVGAIMSGQTIPEFARPMVEAKAREEDRVVIRLSPQWTVYTPPGHLYAGDDGSNLKHGLAERMPWVWARGGPSWRIDIPSCRTFAAVSPRALQHPRNLDTAHRRSARPRAALRAGHPDRYPAGRVRRAIYFAGASVTVPPQAA